MFSQVLSSHCIFCASACLPKFTVIDGQVSRIKCEPDLITPDSVFPLPTGSSSCTPLPHFQQEGEECAQLAEQLNSIFILRNILGIREDKLCQFLGKLGGQFHPELWLQVCTSCGESVKEFYETTKQFLRLKKKLQVISNELKGHIRETREGDYSAGEEVTGQVWKEVREEVLKEFGFNSSSTQPEEIPPPTEQNIEEPMPHLERETEFQDKDQTRQKQKLVATPNPDDYQPNQEESHSPSPQTPPMMILPPDIYVVEEVDAEEDDQNTNQSFISGDILPETSENLGAPDEIDEEYHFDLKFSNGKSTSLKTQINLSKTSSQNQLFHPKKQKVSSKPIQKRSFEVVSPSSFRQYELESVRRYPLPTLPFSECPRFSGVRVGKEQHYECLECSAKSNHWERFKAHLELHHPTAGAVKCGECGWLVHPGKMLRHTAQFHA